MSDQVTSQLKRVRGQIDGILTMYQDERACLDIVHQVVAARNALGRVARDLLTNQATKCNKEQNFQELDLILKEIFKN